MPFQLRDVGMECFTLMHEGVDIGSVFSTDDGHAQPWMILLQERRFRSAADLPPPFTSSHQRFATLRDLEDWLGISARSMIPAEMPA